MKEIILFDFDGVIVDSFNLSFSIIKRFRTQITTDEYRAIFNGNVYDLQKDEDIASKNKAVEYFFDAYAKEMVSLNCVQGMPDLIKKLAKDHTLIIVSSTTHAIIDSFLQKNNLKQYFSEIMGPDVHKYKTEKIRIIFEKYQVSSDECLFITDTLGDIKEAHEVDVECIAVTWGFHSRKILKDGNPYAIAENLDQLLKFIKKFR